jgi:hypothetical protein
LIEAKFPEKFWVWAVEFFIKIRNLLPSKGSINPRISCYQIFKREILFHLQAFGQVAGFTLTRQSMEQRIKPALEL